MQLAVDVTILQSDVGYNDNTIKTQFSVHSIVGNVRGQSHNFNEINNTPLPKRKKLVP